MARGAKPGLGSTITATMKKHQGNAVEECRRGRAAMEGPTQGPLQHLPSVVPLSTVSIRVARNGAFDPITQPLPCILGRGSCALPVHGGLASGGRPVATQIWFHVVERAAGVAGKGINPI